MIDCARKTSLRTPRAIENLLDGRRVFSSPVLHPAWRAALRYIILVLCAERRRTIILWWKKKVIPRGGRQSHRRRWPGISTHAAVAAAERSEELNPRNQSRPRSYRAAADSGTDGPGVVMTTARADSVAANTRTASSGRRRRRRQTHRARA